MENSKKRILVVEDERPLLEAAKAKLSQSGFDVLTARGVEEAESYFEGDEKNIELDVIWLDHYLLGNKSGFDLIVSLRERGGILGQIPIFVVSNTATPDKIQSYIRFGVEKYYTKSDHSLEEIIKDITDFLDNNE